MGHALSPALQSTMMLSDPELRGGTRHVGGLGVKRNVLS